MKDIMKLADAYAEYKDHSEYVHSRAALQSALEALQAENERLKDQIDGFVNGQNQLFDAAKVLEAERDALAAKLVPLEADAKRLDYLQQGVTVELLYSGLAPDFRIGGHIAGTSHDIRVAIDAAKGGQQ